MTENPRTKNPEKAAAYGDLLLKLAKELDSDGFYASRYIVFLAGAMLLGTRNELIASGMLLMGILPFMKEKLGKDDSEWARIIENMERDITFRSFIEFLEDEEK